MSAMDVDLTKDGIVQQFAVHSVGGNGAPFRRKSRTLTLLKSLSNSK